MKYISNTLSLFVASVFISTADTFSPLKVMSPDYVFDVLFTGTGQSSSVPLIKHITRDMSCEVCKSALIPGSKNRRNNVSCAIIKRKKIDPVGGSPRITLIDCGKTFRETVVNLFPKYGIQEIGALLLSHGHADACLGIDDLRDLQVYEQVDPGVRYLSGPMQVYLHEETMKVIERRFDYLTQTPVYLDKSKEILERPVSYLQFNVIEVNHEFEADGIPIRSFPVYHGGDYISLGFHVGKKGQFIYISDVKVIPAETMDYLKAQMPIDTLVLDCIKTIPDGANKAGNFAHAHLEESLQWVDILQPRRCFLVGMGCGIGDHDEANAEIRRRGYENVQLAYDGMYLSDFPLWLPAA